MNSLSALRLSSCSGKPCAAFKERSAVTTVAPITRICGRCARMRPTTSLMPFCAFSTRSIAVAAEIVDPFEPDHGGDAGALEHVALEALRRRRPAGERFLWTVFRRPCDLIAADAGIDHRDAVAVHGMQPPGQHVGPTVVAVHSRRRSVGD